ncbi:MAG: hypothetical protein AB1898_18280, partial [Acidobacteriota bacterium]
KRAPMTRGLNPNFNHRLKYMFKSAAIDGIHQAPFDGYYQRLLLHSDAPALRLGSLARWFARAGERWRLTSREK